MTWRVGPPSSVLAIPGHSGRFLRSATQTVADVLMLDLEDGVAEADKADARELLSRSIATTLSGRRLWLRVNGVDSTHWDADVMLVRGALPNLEAVVVPKAGQRALRFAAAKMHLPIIPLIESAGGVEESDALGRNPEVPGAMFGRLDYIRSISAVGGVGARTTDWAEGRVVNGMAAHGKWSVAGPTPEMEDLSMLEVDAIRERDLGFVGKLCIHPAQIQVVSDAFGVSEAERAWAHRVLEARERANGGAFRFEGSMIDAPVIERAMRIAVGPDDGLR